MATDVVLVHPPRGRKGGPEHIGLGYLAAALRRRGVHTEIIDAHLLGASVPQVVESIGQAAPRLVGITGTQPQGRAMLAIAEGVRARLPQAHITAGGHFATFCHGRLLRDVSALDSVVRGEGDLVFVDLAKRVLDGEEWRGLPGVSFRQDGAVTSNPPGFLVANLDDLPFPARDTARIAMARSRWLRMSTSRGCYARCTFCSIRAFYGLQPGHAWRARSAGNVVEEMAALVREYGCNTFQFNDDNFIGPGQRGRERAHAFADKLIRHGLGCQFVLRCRADDVERDLFLHLREAGLRAVWLGLESGNQRQLDRLCKATTVEGGRRAISILRDLGIHLAVFLIMFDPDSTLDECLETLRFVATAGILRDAVGFDNAAYPLDGTELCEQLRQQGRLRGSYLDGYSYSFRDLTVAACARIIQPIARLLTGVASPGTLTYRDSERR